VYSRRAPTCSELARSLLSRRRLRAVVASLALQTAVSEVLLVPWTRTFTGQRSFAAYGPRTWNRPPTALRSPELSLASFKRQLKTHLSAPALDSAGCRCGCRVPLSGAVVTTASSAPTTNVQTRLDSTPITLRLQRDRPHSIATRLENDDVTQVQNFRDTITIFLSNSVFSIFSGGFRHHNYYLLCNSYGTTSKCTRTCIHQITNAYT